MRLLLTALSVVTMLSGCATSSGVNKLGPDTYTVSTSASLARGGISGAKGLAFAEAEKKCAELGREIFVVNFTTSPSHFSYGGNAEIIFNCVERKVRAVNTTAPSYPDFATTQKAAQNGNAEAQCLLGLFYLHGMGVQKDVHKGMQWLRKSADQGYLDAQFNLGLITLRGEAGPKDEKQATQWFRKAAERGFPKAQYVLGMMYAHGQGVPQDITLARQWLMKAAEQGDTDAQADLRKM